VIALVPRGIGFRLVCTVLAGVVPWTFAHGADPDLEERRAIRLVRVESIIERTLASTPIPLSPEAKSFLVPGWGQFAQKRPVPGLFFAALEAAAITAVVVYAVRGSRAYDRYQAATTPEEAERYRQETIDADRVRNIGIASGALIWGGNLVDVVLAERRARKSRKASTPAPDGAKR
jgi:hypothetical protein